MSTFVERHSLPLALLHSDAERLLNHLQGRHKIKATTTLPAVSSDEVEFALQTERRCGSSPSRTVAYHVTYCRYSGNSSQCQGVSLREICESIGAVVCKVHVRVHVYNYVCTAATDVHFRWHQPSGARA